MSVNVSAPNEVGRAFYGALGFVQPKGRTDAQIKKDLKAFGMSAKPEDLARERAQEQEGLVLNL